MVELRPYHWHENNTKCTVWSERDRACVRLTDMNDNEIVCLWDDEVWAFEEDGFKRRSESWHKALSNYATEMKLRAERRRSAEKQDVREGLV